MSQPKGSKMILKVLSKVTKKDLVKPAGLNQPPPDSMTAVAEQTGSWNTDVSERRTLETEDRGCITERHFSTEAGTEATRGYTARNLLRIIQRLPLKSQMKAHFPQAGSTCSVPTLKRKKKSIRLWLTGILKALLFHFHKLASVQNVLSQWE